MNLMYESICHEQFEIKMTFECYTSAFIFIDTTYNDVLIFQQVKANVLTNSVFLCWMHDFVRALIFTMC